MDRLIYSSLAAMRGAMARQTVVASNLANAGTTGFRAEMEAARPLWIEGQQFAGRATVSEEVSGADMTAGTVLATGRNLDVALDKDAMLAVQAPDGSEAYTRRGDLQLSDSGLMTTGDGRPVLGPGGPITVPPADSLSIDADGTIWIVPAGGDPKSPQQVDRLKLVSPKGTAGIEKGNDGVFHAVGGGALPADPDARVTAKSLEGSNVNPTQALMDMIDSSRNWETHVKMLTTAQQMDQSATDLMRLPD